MNNNTLNTMSECLSDLAKNIRINFSLEGWAAATSVAFGCLTLVTINYIKLHAPQVAPQDEDAT